MIVNKNLWTLGLPVNEWICLEKEVVHYSGVRINNFYLENEPKDILKLIGNKIHKYATSRSKNFFSGSLGGNWRKVVVGEFNASTRIINTIHEWLISIGKIEKNISYSLDTLLTVVDGVINDTSIKIPIMDSRFVPRNTLGQCVMVNYYSAKKLLDLITKDILNNANRIYVVVEEHVFDEVTNTQYRPDKFKIIRIE